RHSELSGQINTKAVVHRLMNMQVTLPMKDILGSSGEICRIISDLIKLKNPKVLSVGVLTAENKHTTGNGRLIRLQLKSNGLIFFSILDTGSELNIISQKLAEQL
ncbi:hypothetical protein BDP27DRAFT_1146741, partial [Rhodocollybia butyracea]